jgi:excisionase family DNA binding protein
MRQAPRRIEPSAFSLEEAAIYAGLTYPTIQKLIREGKLPASKVGSRVVVRRAALDRLLYDTQIEATA